MGSINVTVTSPQGTVTVNKNVADADLARLVEALGVYLDAQFQQQGGPNAQPPPPKTNANLIKAWVNNWLTGTKRLVQRYEASKVSVADLPIADA